MEERQRILKEQQQSNLKRINKMVLKDSDQWCYNESLLKNSEAIALLTKNVAYRII